MGMAGYWSTFKWRRRWRIEFIWGWPDTKSIVQSAVVFIAEHLVCSIDSLELLIRNIFVQVGCSIRMCAKRLSLVCFANFIDRGIATDTQNVVKTIHV
jgi:hypothetical protein